MPAKRCQRSCNRRAIYRCPLDLTTTGREFPNLRQARRHRAATFLLSTLSIAWFLMKYHVSEGGSASIYIQSQFSDRTTILNTRTACYLSVERLLLWPG
jgi:hypothetical protein